MLTDGQVGHGLRKGVAEVRVLRVAPVPRPVAGIDRELHQVGQAPDLLGARCLAAGQGAEAVELIESSPRASR